MEAIQEWHTPHRAYRITRHTFTKRELASSELELDMQGRKILLPPDSSARLENEFYTLQYLRKNTKIPVPVPIELTKKDGIVTLTTSCVQHDAVALSDYAERDRDSVIEEVERELTLEIIPALHRETSKHMGGLNKDERLLVPPRVTDYSEKEWPRFTSEERPFVLCHNDLGQANIFIHPITHRILAIVDWEYAGFYPPQFEAQLWRFHPREQDWNAHRPAELYCLLEEISRAKVASSSTVPLQVDINT